MSWLNLFPDDEKLGKKDDDHRPQSQNQSQPWARAPAQPLRRRRIFYLLCGALFVFLFIKNLPTDVGPHPRWADKRIYQPPGRDDRTSSPSSGTTIPPSSSQKPPRPASPSESEEHYHDGPIKFYKLAVSLHAVAKLGGQKDINKNVLFAAANLKSVSELLPLACEMARWERNDVHLAIMGRDDMEIEEIQTINGITKEDCNIHWHDARPDFSKWSTDFRMESSVAASLEHIQTFIHPQVVLIDDSKREDRYLIDAIREKAMELFKPLIELPPNAMENLMWLTRLDSASLAAWPRVQIDIVIQAPSGSSGSMVRLLKSLENADYFGLRRPHLTVELPAEIDEPTARYLEYFLWPPADWSGTPQASQVTLRHRIPRKTTTVEEASARLVESFWPKKPLESHVLLLSPQIELSPLYFHYLFYSVLEYRYSLLAMGNEKYHKLMGISLHLPDSQLDDKSTFDPPTSNPSKSKAGAFPGSQPPFLWQAPNNDAALYFGDRWMEFHSFLSLRLTKPPSTSKKMISESHPAWMEYLLEFMRLRGYSVLYPGAFFNDFTISTVHDELYKVPEEFTRKPKAPSTRSPPSSLTKPLEGNSSTTRKAPPNREKPLLESSLTHLLPNKADLLEVDRMPLLSLSGESTSFNEANEAAQSFANDFKRTVGGCSSDHAPSQRTALQAIDLFCDPNAPFDYHTVTEPMYADAPNPDKKSASSSKDLTEEAISQDEDQISASEAKRAKLESESHFNRQAGDEAAKSRPKEQSEGKGKGEEKNKEKLLEKKGEKVLAVEEQAKKKDTKVDKKLTRPKSEAEDDAEDSKLAESAEKKSQDRAKGLKTSPRSDADDDEDGNRSAGW